jgi:tocopherol cyclase
MGLHTLYHPEVFQGNLNRRRYFEGWYFKQVMEGGAGLLSIIPGISLAGDRHAFIQVIEGITGTTHYIDFPLDDFRADKRILEIRIGGNSFTREGMHLDIDRQGLKLSGDLRFIHPVPWPGRLLAPGIMGWYSFVPRMECYHGVVSIDHRLDGHLHYQGSGLDFTGGRGYIEKDWGTSMPESWIWLHSNTFETTGTSVMLSVARIPWLGNHFTGFIAFVLHAGTLYRFATYNRSRISRFRLEGPELDITLDNRHFRLDIRARQKVAGQLKAPVKGIMERYIKESIDSDVEIRLAGLSGSVIFEGAASRSGLELVGRPGELWPRTGP